MTGRVVIAVDGGNSKTELALVREDGTLLARARAGGSSPHYLGLEPALDVVEELVRKAATEAGVELPVEAAQLSLAGVDFPREVALATERATARRWARATRVDNDTFALLRAGTDRGWGVAIVCGAGINCVGVAPDGRHARFPALGPLTGDWGGGQDVGMAAISAAVRSEDGRGPRTALEHAVPAHFGLGTPSELAEAIHFGELAAERLVELAPLVLREAADDPVAASIRDRLVDEVVALARVTLERLDLRDAPVDVVLGGGFFQSRDAALADAVARGLADVVRGAIICVADAPPVLGAALLALDGLGAAADARARLRTMLGTPIPLEATHG